MKIQTSTARRGALHALAAATIVAFTMGIASPALAGEPGYLGQDGQQLIIPDEVMTVTGAGPQGQLEPGTGGSFYSATWSGSGTNDTLIYRYFEDGTAATSWNTNDAVGVIGKVYSISTDAAGNVFSLHRTGRLPDPVSIARWTPEGSLVGIVTPVIPGVTDGASNGLAVSADGTTAYLRVDAASPSTQNGIWRVDLASGAVSPLSLGLAATGNSEQTPWMQVDHDTGAIAFAADTNQVGVIADPAGAPETVTTYDVSGTIRGIDMTEFTEGTIYVTPGTSIVAIDAATKAQTTVVNFGQIGFFNTYASRWGTDGRLYISGFSPWGVLPVDFMQLKSSEITYPEGTITTNLCAPSPVDLAPELTGNPLPTWVTISEGALPAGVSLDSGTGAVTGTPTEAGSVTLQAKNGVSRAASSAPDTFGLTFATVSEDVAFTSATKPKISGTATVGKTLTASVSAWDPAATFSYQWQRNGTPIAGATGAQYSLTEADADARVTVSVTGAADCRITATLAADALLVSEAEKPDPIDPGPTPPGPTDPGPTPPTSDPKPVDPKPAGPGHEGDLAASGASSAIAAAGALAAAALGAGVMLLLDRRSRRQFMARSEG